MTVVIFSTSIVQTHDLLTYFMTDLLTVDLNGEKPGMWRIILIIHEE